MSRGVRQQGGGHVVDVGRPRIRDSDRLQEIVEALAIEDARAPRRRSGIRLGQGTQRNEDQDRKEIRAPSAAHHVALQWLQWTRPGGQVKAGDT